MVIESLTKLGFIKENTCNYECINESKSWVSAMIKGGRGANGLIVEYNATKKIISSLNEGVEWELEEGQKGGIIVFSTDVNAVKQPNNALINMIKQFFTTLSNRLNANKKIDKVTVKHNLVGWTVGRYWL